MMMRMAKSWPLFQSNAPFLGCSQPVAVNGMIRMLNVKWKLFESLAASLARASRWFAFSPGKKYINKSPWCFSEILPIRLRRLNVFCLIDFPLWHDWVEKCYSNGVRWFGPEAEKCCESKNRCCDLWPHVLLWNEWIRFRAPSNDMNAQFASAGNIPRAAGVRRSFPSPAGETKKRNRDPEAAVSVYKDKWDDAKSHLMTRFGFSKRGHFPACESCGRS